MRRFPLRPPTWWPAALLTLLIFAFLMFPFYAMIVTALKDLPAVYAYPPVFWPQSPAWQNFLHVWTEVPLRNFLASSLIVASGATVLALVAGVPAAYSLARFTYPGRAVFLRLILIAQMLSPVVIIIPLFRVMVAVGFIDTYWGLIVADAAFNLSFGIWLLTSYFSTIPKEIEEAALVDGASRIGTLRHVMLPLAGPGLVTVTIYAFITSWNEFMLALTLITTPDKKPVPVGLFQLVGKFEIQWNLLSAGAIIGTIPTVLLFLLIQRQIVRGLSAGAVKS